MSNFLANNVINKLHTYTAVTSAVPAARTQDRLPDDAWQPKAKMESLKFKEVEGTKQSTEWYSPVASNLCVPTADLYFLRAVDLSQWAIIRTAWQGPLFKCTRRLMFCHKARPIIISLVCRPSRSRLLWCGL